MAPATFSNKINALFRDGEWEQARALLERHRVKEPESHWLLTQLGVTFYEQKKYRQALKLFNASRKIVDDCPLTLWNLAGTYDALGEPARALKIFTWLLRSDKSPADDPCWEGRGWTESLKTDVVYRIGACFEHLGKKKDAEHYFRQYLQLLSVGASGMYPSDEVIKRIRGLHSAEKRAPQENGIHKGVHVVLQALGDSLSPVAKSPPAFEESSRGSRRRVASKR